MAEKSYEKIFVHDISCKNSIGARPMCIRYDKINGFVRVYTGSEYLLLCRAENFDVMYSRIRYLIGVKICITYVISYYYAKT